LIWRSYAAQSPPYCARPVAPSGWPLEMRPPEGLTTQVPP
jgi:hypothetical protein